MDLKKKDIREWAVKVLGKMGESAVGPLTRAMKDENYYVREVAAKALGEIGDERAVEFLIHALDDEDHYVQEAAIMALGEIGDARAVEPLLMFFENKEKYSGNIFILEIIKKAAEALGKIRDVRAVEPFIQILYDDMNNHFEVQWKAAEALGNIGDERAVKALIDALGKVGRGVSDEGTTHIINLAAEKALIKIGTASVEPLIQSLKHSNPRFYAARALGEIGDSRAIEPLVQILEDEDHYVRQVAANALYKMGWKAGDDMGKTYI
jgi:HEAT repeat protein